jgi:serine/threonine protein phosphatase PrpC
MKRGPASIVVWGKTDVGRRRERNEDAVSWDPDIGLVLLADGMGGHQAGHVASETAVAAVEHVVSASSAERPEEAEVLIRGAIAEANRAIHERSHSDAVCAGMGTTIVAALFCAGHVVVGHVGDSRLYRLREGRLAPLTVDHSLVQELVGEGFMTLEEAKRSVGRNVITRALGIEPQVEPELQSHRTRGGDLYLLCSDGLSDMVDDETMQSLLGRCGDDLAGGGEALIDEANVRGGEDNIAVVLVWIPPTAAGSGE